MIFLTWLSPEAWMPFVVALSIMMDQISLSAKDFLLNLLIGSALLGGAVGWKMPSLGALKLLNLG
ncbi:MAG: hypothetical protein ABW098_11130 [Candidatus Thiodiazotropha sp.]